MITTVGCLQPTYLPWIPFFKRFLSCDYFVLLDDVDYSKNSNQNKVRYYQKQQNILRSIMPKYLDNIVANLENRFQENGFIEKMQVLQPIHIPRKES